MLPIREDGADVLRAYRCVRIDMKVAVQSRAACIAVQRTVRGVNQRFSSFAGYASARGIGMHATKPCGPALIASSVSRSQPMKQVQAKPPTSPIAHANAIPPAAVEPVRNVGANPRVDWHRCGRAPVLTDENGRMVAFSGRIFCADAAIV
ncbi:hypothetical protein WT39_03175 [Burkholderia territorii]|nr:hypothetical protein WT39_03175 [Burkholderia territorii]